MEINHTLRTELALLRLPAQPWIRICVSSKLQTSLWAHSRLTWFHMEPFLGPQPWQRCQEHWPRSRREEHLPSPPNPREREISSLQDHSLLETANPASLWLQVPHALLELAPGLYVLAQKSPCEKYLRGYSPLFSSSDLMERFTFKPMFAPMGLQILHSPRNIPIFSDTMCNPWTLFPWCKLGVVNAQTTSADPRLFQVSD